jgi:type I restriction enzyme R subunit
MPLNEADTRVQLIDPKLREAGWSDSLITREHFYRRDHRYTAGRIYLVGDEARRREPRRVDYLLRYTDAFPIAVVEAKDESQSPNAGLEQAKRYARELGLTFAYSSNGHGIVEYDFFTHGSSDLTGFPTPDDLWERWLLNTGATEPERASAVARPEITYAADRYRNPLLHPYCPRSQCGKEPFYFQEVAISQVVRRMMRGQRRILLTMATGTGKTFVAFQIAWKLSRSGWLNRLHRERPGRVLFLADRVVLRDQAYNHFSPFADGTSDPRRVIEGHPPNLNRDLYFAIYQTLWSENEDGERLFRRFPRDFFDLVIIDECHRSGFGTWREILDHFETAIHLGMTATPKQDESVDTYDYFCREEPEVFIDANDPTRGTWRPPAYQYSLGQGIEDGFLATYKVHKVRTTVDRAGLHIQDALVQGAEIYVPEGAELRDIYHTPQFEREITLPDRTRAMCDHLAGLLHRTGPMDRTMVFCVDMAHARLVAENLQTAFGYLGYDNYAVPIISEEGEEGRRVLEQFQDSDKKVPVVATTAELLSTGVDVPSCRNIVFMKTLASPLLFKQIIGRGSRVDPATGKLWFRIVDYTGATRLFDEWDRPPGLPPEAPSGPRTAALEGQVVFAESGMPIVGASVLVLTGPNEQQGPILTGEDGRFGFTELPVGGVTLIAGGTGLRRRQLRVETLADETVTLVIELRFEMETTERIRVEGLEVTIADEATFLVEATGEQLSLEQYLDYTRRKVVGYVPEWARLWEVWVDPEKRHAFLEDLRRASIHVEVLADVLRSTASLAVGGPEADQFDLLAHIAYGKPVRTRRERARAFETREGAFLDRYREDVREVILALLVKYRVGGVEQLADPRVFRTSPFREMGQAPGVIRRFGGAERLQETVHEMQRRLYAA